MLEYRVERVELGFAGTVSGWAACCLPAGTRRIMVATTAPVRAAGDPRERAAERGEWLPAATGDAACQLARWDLDDRGLAGALGKEGCDAAAQAAREAAHRAFESCRINPLIAGAGSLGRRRSRASGHAFPLEGHAGLIALEGDLDAVAPWLVVLATHGGAKRSFGLGRVELWRPAAEL